MASIYRGVQRPLKDLYKTILNEFGFWKLYELPSVSRYSFKGLLFLNVLWMVSLWRKINKSYVDRRHQKSLCRSPSKGVLFIQFYFLRIFWSYSVSSSLLIHLVSIKGPVEAVWSIFIHSLPKCLTWTENEPFSTENLLRAKNSNWSSMGGNSHELCYMGRII